MTQNAILFIPDISGFTEFVHHTDISHSRHIISELLELLIDTNTMDLELAEIEGDALFMYKVENQVDVLDIEKQIEAMYLAFHTHIKRYEYQRICHCGACSSAYNLKIKFVVHYGDIEFIKVKDSKKPYGSHVIQVHRLLKNDIPLKEYALFTENVQPVNEQNKLIAEYDFGTITFSYNSLSHLKEKLPEIEPVPNDVPKHKLFDVTELVKTPMLELYEVISNFDYRLLWTKGVNKLEYEKNKVNRLGQKHRCLVNKNQEVEQTTITKSGSKDQLVYGESTTNLPFIKRLSGYFILEETENNDTKLQVQVFANFKPLGIIMKPLIKKKLKIAFLENLKELILLIDSGFSTKK
ncbi:DUF2652 domain-containing protein [Flavivirga aquimarina]|uniref:DUF2652 domain-containing protein n=1 Tax=Flavivirga aquimarina TaxID=2027862 RepID=A0ABT8W8S4_9FLAO|nr:DUF2652 domain-containing protein [Flavivirga aquimarina]MDO5969510.1 DUF2652 domain-containing protein [Flavivirga aquimarina]